MGPSSRKQPLNLPRAVKLCSPTLSPEFLSRYIYVYMYTCRSGLEAVTLKFPRRRYSPRKRKTCMKDSFQEMEHEFAFGIFVYRPRKPECLPFVRKFGWNFLSSSTCGLVLFGHRKHEWECVVPFTIFRGSLALIIQTDGSGNFSRFDKSGEKGNTSEGIMITSSPETFERSLELPGFTVQMVSAPGLPYPADVPWLPEKFPLKRPKCRVPFTSSNRIFRTLFVNDKQPTSPWFPWFFPTVFFSTKKWSYRHI